ncbi:uncharacterized GMC-type oxidoreductase Mb1310-like [Mytilus californianus]|uniref:uncharacterized GMC-type oxidoreductase Mb1310-like n=1 Tax=Mytilus californianus TaxID=6549 RepID=UPI002246B9FB|nr:uncharacterized GMC-type oxidoreductase Mb1310-like [Mytilus californianus]
MMEVFCRVAVLSTVFIPMTISERILNEPTLDSYDYIVVGGGTAGSVLASRLSEDPVSVLLLEAGGSELDNPLIDVPLMTTSLQFSEQDWQYFTVPQTNSSLSLTKKQGYWPVGKVLGGSSSTHYMVHIRGSPHDYDEWAAEGCDGWSYNDVLPYFKKSEDVQIPEYKDKAYRSTGGPITVTSNPTADSQLISVYQQSALEKGWAITDCSGPNITGFCPTQNDVRAGTRCSTAKAYIRPALNRNNLQVSINSHVTKIKIENNRAVGVVFMKDGKIKTVAATKEIILSAGAIGSAQLLMLSGVGPREHLEELKIDVKKDLPVGNNLKDHLLIVMSYKLNVSWAVNQDKLNNAEEQEKYILNKKGIYSGTGCDALLFAQTGKESHDRGSPDVEVHFFSSAPEEEQLRNGLDQNIKNELLDKMVADASSTGIRFLPVYLHPKSQGTIRLKSKDPFDYPALDPNYLAHQDDVDGFVRAARVVQKIASSTAMQKIGAILIPRVYEGFCDDVEFDSDDYWRCYTKNLASSAFHYSCTCRMGSANDPTAVVDPQLRVKGILGLRVADASVMRDIVSGNTHTPVVMIAEKAADMIRGRTTIG